MKKQKQLGKPSKPNPSRRGGYVQTEQAAHEAWARLILDKPKCAALMHIIVSRMDRGSNALVISQANLGKLLGASTRTIQRHLKDLEADRWIQIVRIGDTGTMNAYVVNSAVAWGVARENLKFAQFTAQVIVSSGDQESLEAPDLRKIPVVYQGEKQLPEGEGEPPPNQKIFSELLPDLPQIDGDKGRQMDIEDV